jgi:AraC-like DNA-binding protein
MEKLDEPGFRVNSAEYETAITSLVRESRLPGLGIRVGLTENASDHGVVGHAMLCARSLLNALNFFVEFQDISGPIVRLSTERKDRFVVVKAFETIVTGPALTYELENTFIGLLSMLSPATRFISVERLLLSYSDPGYADLYEKNFGCKPVFSAGANEMWLREHDLRASPKLESRETFDMCRRQCEVIRGKIISSGTLTDQVRRLMATSTGIFPSEQQIAETLGLSSRTLRRRLADEGTGFRHMMDDARLELAKEHLSRTRLTITEIAERVGYSSVHSFHRAFKRGTGQTPGFYRNQPDGS